MSNSKLSKKEARTLIVQRLEAAFSDLKVTLGDKKFNNRAKKAARLLTEGFKANATAEIVEKPAKKTKAKPVATKKKKVKTKATIEKAAPAKSTATAE